MQHMPKLDGLRGIAIILVLIAHIPVVHGAGIMNFLLTALKRSGAGYIGVEIFFVLSGYLITKILLDNISRDKIVIFRDFYLKRTFRIFPVMYITIGTCYLFYRDFEYFYPSLFLSNYYFSFNSDPHPLRHFWSLAVEEQFYVFWPVLLVLTRNSPAALKISIATIIVVSLSSTLIRDFVFATEVARELIYRSLESRMLALGLGGAMAIYGVPQIKLKTLLVAVTLSMVLSMVLWGLHRIGHEVYIASVYAISFAIVSTAAFIFAMNDYGHLNRFVANSYLQAVGKISYGLYVYHLPVFFYFGVSSAQIQSTEADGADVALALMLTFAVAICSWYLIEKPLLMVKARFFNKKTTVKPQSDLRDRSD